MRIGIDAHYVGVRHGGNELYFENIASHLSRVGRREDEYFVFSYRLAAQRRLPAARITHLPLTARSVSWQRAVEIPRYCRRLGLEVLHVPFNFWPAGRARKIVTIHDVAFLDLPGMYSPLERARMTWLTRFAARHAHRILTVSEFCKHSIMDHYGVEESRITVTPSATDRDLFRPLDPEARAAARRRMRVEYPYILFVGLLHARKNVITLLRAYQRLRSRGRREVHLVIVGRRGWRWREVARYFRDRELRDVVHHLESMGMDDLVALYNNASVMVLPSHFEGFGAPILEAMSCGCPVVCSHVAAMPETYGDAALPFDPNDPEELAAQLERVLDDRALRDDLVRRGFANCDRFSWERSARIVDAAYHS